MPKVPASGTGYVSSVDVPGEAPFERASGVAFGQATTVAAHQGAQQIEASALLAQRHIQAIEADKERQRRNDAAMGGLQTGLEQLGQAENELRFGSQNEAPATSADYLPRWKSKADAIRQGAVSDVAKQHGPEVGDILNRHLAHEIQKRYFTAEHYATNLYVQEQGAESARQDDQALRLFVAEQDPQEGEAILNRRRAGIQLSEPVFGPERTQARLERFNQKALGEKANILARSAEGREQLYKAVEEGKFDGLDPDRLSRIVANAQAADQRAEGAGRRNEAAIKAAKNDREIEIGTLIAQRNVTEAARKLEFYADLRLLDSNDIDKWRKAIATPAFDKVSDPAVAGRVLLDVESINPRTTEAQIDELYAKGQRGEPGLSLTDAVKAKNQLRATRVALQNRVQDQEQAALQREHNQSEQELRAMLGIKPGLVESIMRDDPAGRLYGQLLPELRQRSKFFVNANDGGKHDEAPLAVVESMRVRINQALGGSVQLRPTEIMGLYPDWQSLERARAQNKITQEQFDQQLQMRRAPVAPPAPAAQPPAAKRKSANFPQ